VKVINIFDFSYPIFDEAYRKGLEQRIIDYFYFREIGFETKEIFVHELKSQMQLLMPVYNRMYLASNGELKAIIQAKQTQTYNKQGTGLSESKTNVKNTNIFEDTPEGKFQIQEGYATNITESTADNKNEQGVSNVEDYVSELIRDNPNLNDAEQVKRFAENLLNVDMMLINDLNKLFMGIY